MKRTIVLTGASDGIGAERFIADVDALESVHEALPLENDMPSRRTPALQP